MCNDLILLWEPDPLLAELLIPRLSSLASVLSCPPTGDFLARCPWHSAGIAVFDLLPPHPPGLLGSVSAQARYHGVPLLALAPDSIAPESAHGDTLLRPFFVSDLLARARACLNRHVTPPSASRVGALLLERPIFRASIGGRSLPLSPTEFRLLDLLASHPGSVVSRRDLAAGIWGDATHNPRAIDVLVGRLRRKLHGRADSVGAIEAHPRAGYLFHLTPSIPPL